MANKIPVKAVYTGTDVTALGEYASTDKIDSAYLNTGTTANDLVQLDGTAKLPAVDGSNLTNMASGTPEGTVILSTGETGGVKYLREDGDGTSSWQIVADNDTTYTAGTGINIDGSNVITSTAIALTTVQTAVDETAQLALTAQEGDIVVRSDENKTYCHNGGSAGTMADYTLLATPTDSVLSVNGDTGAVTVTHDGLSDFVANEHIDWTADQGATNLHAGNYTDTNTTYSVGDGGLSEINFTSADNSKLDGIATGADVTSANETSHADVLVDGDVGTTANKLVQLDGTAKLPAVDGSALTNLPSGGFTSSTFLDQGTLFSRDSANTLSIPDLGGVVDGTLVEVTATTKALNTSGNWDGVGSYETASNRAGKDFYVYLLSAGGVILSNSSTYPSGYTAANSRKIAGFHCLAVAVGTISGHSLTGYAQGDILPRSVWDRFNRPISAPEGMVLSDDGMWVDIYLPSYSGTLLKSVNGGTIADGSNGWHGYKFEQWFGDIGKKLIRQTEFVTASIGANQGTNIAGSADPSTTTGHTDTAGRRMISNIGCEDMAGVMNQWSRDPGGVYSSGASWANAYDGNDSGVAGKHYQAPYRANLGGAWNNGLQSGSRSSLWTNSPLYLTSSFSGRGVSEPAANRL